MLNIRTAFGEPLRRAGRCRAHRQPGEQQGAAAYHAGRNPQENPNPANSAAAIEWTRGYREASRTWYEASCLRELRQRGPAAHRLRR